MRIILLVIKILLHSLNLSSAARIECDYVESTWGVVGYQYACNVKNNVDINTPQDSVIHSITGTHHSDKNFDFINNFFAYDKNIQYFPQGLEKIFKNIKVLIVSKCHLKEIHQFDLRPFTSLIELQMYDNEIEILEEGLLDFNRELVAVYFHKNKISQIHSTIFDHLNKLACFHLSANKCIDRQTDGNHQVSLEIISQMKTLCPNPKSKEKVDKTDFYIMELRDKTSKLESQISAMSHEIEMFKDLNSKLNEKLLEISENCKSSENLLKANLLEIEGKIKGIVVENHIEMNTKIQKIQEKFDKKFENLEYKVEKSCENC